MMCVKTTETLGGGYDTSAEKWRRLKNGTTVDSRNYWKAKEIDIYVSIHFDRVRRECPASGLSSAEGKEDQECEAVEG